MGLHVLEKLKKGSRSISKSGTLMNTIQDAFMRGSRVRPTRANESIPSPRHRAQTALQEQSIRFPLLYLTCKRKLD